MRSLGDRAELNSRERKRTGRERERRKLGLAFEASTSGRKGVNGTCGSTGASEVGGAVR